MERAKIQELNASRVDDLQGGGKEDFNSQTSLSMVDIFHTFLVIHATVGVLESTKFIS